MPPLIEKKKKTLNLGSKDLSLKSRSVTVSLGKITGPISGSTYSGINGNFQLKTVTGAHILLNSSLNIVGETFS